MLYYFSGRKFFKKIYTIQPWYGRSPKSYIHSNKIEFESTIRVLPFDISREIKKKCKEII